MIQHNTRAGADVVVSQPAPASIDWATKFNVNQPKGAWRCELDGVVAVRGGVGIPDNRAAARQGGSGALDWKPETGSNWMTVGQLLKHISKACGAGCKGLVLGDWGLPAGKPPDDLLPEENLPPAENLPCVDSVEEAKRLLAKDEAVALEMIARAGESDLANRVVAAPWTPEAPMPLGRHLLRMIEHLERHKSQLFYYLKLQGERVDTADLWTLDTPRGAA